ncbi:MAG TPA: amino acid permease [Thermoleophilia bacterium]|nr:amino acid permease [Thermoleophilia bacterium]
MAESTASQGSSLAFERKASGLVRGLDMWDAFGAGLMTCQPIATLWLMVGIALSLFPQGNLLIAIGLGAVTAGLGAPLVWGILSSSMPRAGGEYVYNSRILHPAIALGAVFTNILAVFYWNWYIATWLGQPALELLGQYMGWESFTTWVGSKSGLIILGLIAIIVGYLSVAFSMKSYAIIQKIMLIPAIGGPVVLIIALFLSSKAEFIERWNAIAAEYGSLDYDAFIAAAALPNTWSWHHTLGAFSGVYALFVYNYVIAYLSGEVKRPDKALLTGNILAVWTPIVLGFLTVVGLYRLVDFNFLSATAQASFGAGVEGYVAPYNPDYLTLTWIASGQSGIVAWAIALAFVAVIWLEITIALLVIARAFLAWGLDRMGPKWFTDVSPRHASPIKNLTVAMLGFAIGLIVLVLWLSNQLAGLVGGGMQFISIFLITGISAVLFPYRKNVRHIWDASPYKTWKLAGIPLVTIGGVLYLMFIITMLYFSFIDPTSREVTGKYMIVFLSAWAAGILWYFFWRAKNAREGIDVSITFGELPPE